MHCHVHYVNSLTENNGNCVAQVDLPPTFLSRWFMEPISEDPMGRLLMVCPPSLSLYFIHWPGHPCGHQCLRSMVLILQHCLTRVNNNPLQSGSYRHRHPGLKQHHSIKVLIKGIFNLFFKASEFKKFESSLFFFNSPMFVPLSNSTMQLA